GGERGEAEAPVSSRFRYYTDASYSRSGKDSGKEMKQVAYVPPCPQWYGDREWNVNLWGTYAFTNTDFAPNPSLVDIVQSTREGGSHLMHGQAWARFLGAAKGTPFTRKGRRTPSKSMRRPNISAAKAKCLVNSAPVWKFVSRGTLGGRMT